MARNASCSNGIIIQLSNPVEKALVEPVLDLGLRKTHFGLRKFFIGKRDITTHRPPPPGCNHENRLARKKRSLAQSLKHPHLQEIETAIERFIQDHNLDYQDELNVRTVVTDIRLLGQADSRQVRLQPRGWVICRPEVVEVVKDIVAKFPSTIPQNLNLGSKIQAGRGGLSWTMADVTHMPETLNMGAGFDLPTHGYKFFLSLEDPIDTSRPRRSSCGLLCFIVVEKGGSRELAQVCRIGGVVEIPDQNGSRKLVAVTVAHGLSDYVLAATSRKKMNGPLGGSQKKGQLFQRIYILRLAPAILLISLQGLLTYVREKKMKYRRNYPLISTGHLFWDFMLSTGWARSGPQHLSIHQAYPSGILET